jgi:ADP-ribosylglycohydrolase
MRPVPSKPKRFPIAFTEADSYEDAVRNAISLGGDSEPLACITGAIAEAYSGPVARQILDKGEALLTADLWSITVQFCREYGPNKDDKMSAARSG